MKPFSFIDILEMLITAVCLLLATSVACSQPYSSRIDTSSTNLTTSYLLVPLPTVSGKTKRPLTVERIQVDNRTSSSEVAVNCSATTSVAPANDIGAVWVAGGETYSTGPLKAGNDCWIKSQTGTISSGIVTVLIQGN